MWGADKLPDFLDNSKIQADFWLNQMLALSWDRLVWSCSEN